MIQDLHITVGELPDGKVKVLYAGRDVIAADKVYSEADTKFKNVAVISHAPPTRVRYPQDESELIANSAKRSENEKERKLHADRLRAEAMQAQAQKLNDEAEKILKTTKKSES
jgi:hypothetical protein